MKPLYQLVYYLLFGLWFAISSIPMCIHYLFSDLCYLLVYYIFRYRRKVVRKNLINSFPDKSEKEIRQIEKKFYAFFCDMFFEIIKLFSISKEELMQRMQFKGLDRLEESCHNGRSSVAYLGHYGNWEWISSIQLWINPEVGRILQIYHPLENPVFDKLMTRIRNRMGSTSIPMHTALRHIIQYKRGKTPIAIGFIADQIPLLENIHYWSRFLNQDTAYFSGAERIAKQLDMDVYYMDVRRVKRGYYEVTFELISDQPKKEPEFSLTECYCRKLEKTILRDPAYWLWSHNRWKRSKEEWCQRYPEKAKQL